MNSAGKRKEIVIDAKEAAVWVKDGMTISIGGFINSSHPMAIIRQIIRNGVKGLTVIGAASAGLEIDLLIGAGCVKKVVAPYVGGEGLAPIAPFFRLAAQRGEIEVWEIDEAQYYAGLRAAAQRLPFNPWRSGVGTSYPVVNPDLKVFQDPIKGETLLAIPAIVPQVALIHAAYSDYYGNAQHIGTGYGDRAHYAAADRTIVQVEKIVSSEEIKRHPYLTSIPGAHAVVRAPYGSHPYSSPGFYRQDDEHIKEYVRAANAYVKDGNRAPFEAYLRKYVLEPNDHIEYLERIGIRALFNLYEY